MGYSLTIGEAKIFVDKDENYIHLVAQPMYDDKCLDFLDSDKNSVRLPSYSNWASFCKDVGLYDLFFDKFNGECILHHHPGTYLLTKATLEQFEKAKNKYLIDFPNAKPVTKCRFNEEYFKKSYMDRRKVELKIQEHDWIITRLEWLCFWTKKSLNECINPILENS